MRWQIRPNECQKPLTPRLWHDILSQWGEGGWRGAGGKPGMGEGGKRWNGEGKQGGTVGVSHHEANHLVF